jgi:hypothetical protein
MYRKGAANNNISAFPSSTMYKIVLFPGSSPETAVHQLGQVGIVESHKVVRSGGVFDSNGVVGILT